VTSVPAESTESPPSLLECIATGVAYAAALCLLGAFLVASFRPNNLGQPYWSEIRRLRTDTSGVLSFGVVALALVVSEYCRLGRRRRGVDPGPVIARRKSEPFTTAVAEVVALLSSALVVYLSVNAVTHPATLLIRVTHFVSWPTEGTLRVVALFLSGCSVAWLRFEAIRSSGG
jgi:hypothetical protein